MRSKFKWIFTLLVAFTMQFSFAQQKTVTGVVSDELGPVAGANVVNQATKAGTTTDFDGNYSISAKQGDVLVISYAGSSQKVTVGTGNTYNVTLNATVLTDVEVVGALGIKREQKAVTYAAQTVQGSSMTEARESNLVNALSGKIAGVQVTGSSGSVGSSSRILLRGANSITGSNAPLFIVDGVPFNNTNYGNADSGGGNDLPNGVASINPDDIESVNVLKGPAASALYGLRASGGVIVITTKSGKKNGKYEVSLNSNITFSNPLVLPNFQNSYGQGSSDNYFEFVDGSGGGTNDGVDESWGPALDRGLYFKQWDSFKYDGAATPWVSHADNIKDFYDTGIAQTNNLTITGGSENIGYRFSVGNSDEKGMVPFTNYKKFNVGLNINAEIGKKMTATAGVTFFNDKSTNLPTVGYNNENVVQQFIWSARNVDYSALRDWRNFPLSNNGTPMNWNNNFQNNPYWVLENNRNTFDKDRVNGNFGLNYKFNDKLSLSGKLLLDHFSQRITAQKEIGTNSLIDGFYSENNRRYSEINAETVLSYTTDLTDNFKFSLNAGMNSMKRYQNVMSGQLNSLELPGLFTLSNVKSGTTPVIDSDYLEQRINSVFGFGQLAYKNWAFLDFTARNDWSSVLPAKNNSFFYPSITGSLVLSDLLNLTNSKLNYLKVRGGWAKVGSTGVLGEYTINKIYNLANNQFGTVSTIPASQFNPEIKPESTIGKEIGVDLHLFKGKIKFSGTYYVQDSEDLIVPIQVSNASGYNSRWDNVASMTNKGIELQLDATVYKNDDFSFDVNLNWAKNENTVNSLGESDSYVVGGQWGMQLEARPGMPYGVITGFPYSRTDDGQIIYENGLPKVNNSKLVPLGNITPDWTGGVGLNFKYKGFDLNTLFDFKMGGDLYSMTYMWGRYAGTLEESLIGRESGITGDGVMSDGNGGYVANNVVVDAKSFNQYAYNYSNFTESGIFDASYIKFRQVVIGYSLPQSLLKNTFIQEFRVSVVGRNLGILYKKVPHIDPETGFSNANSEQGQEFGQLPSARSYGFNINVKF